jgi:hypothetical protein
MDRSRVVVPALLMVSFVACSDAPRSLGGSKQQMSAGRQSTDADGFGGLEGEFAEIASVVPTFAGFYYDRSGTLVVRLVGEPPDPGLAAQVVELIRAKGRRVGTVSVVSARFGFSDLARWRQMMRDGLSAGVYSLDVDEVANVLSAGVSDSVSAIEVRALSRRLGVPDGGVSTFIAPQPQFRQTLSDQVRPLRGGIQTTWAGGGLCSIMIDGRWAPGNYPGFFTASHCSTNYVRSDPGLDYYQPTAAQANFVGEEFEDLAPFSGGSCATGRVCRWADVLFVITDESSFEGFSIAKPSGEPAVGGRGSTTIAGTFESIAAYSPAVGDSLQKVGRTSGWTKGAVTATCQDKWSGARDSQGREIWILCNDITSIWSEGGDSGSPIFFRLYPDADYVYLAGILWGGPSNNFNETWFSPCWNVQHEMPLYDGAC